MKALIFAIILTAGSTYSFGQQTKVENVVKKETKSEQEIIQLSKDKWDWMSAKDSEKLDKLFDEKSVFVHMGGSWGKKQELDVIKSGGIWYKKADIHDVSVNIIDNAAIVLTKMDLLAVVGGNEVTNPFIVTEVFVKKEGSWQLGSLSFTKTLASSGK